MRENQSVGESDKKGIHPFAEKPPLDGSVRNLVRGNHLCQFFWQWVSILQGVEFWHSPLTKAVAVKYSAGAGGG